MHDLHIYVLIGMFMLSASLSAAVPPAPQTPDADYPDDDYQDYDDDDTKVTNATSAPSTTHNSSQPFISMATLMALQNKLEIPSRTNYVLEPVCPAACQCLDDFRTVDCSGANLTETPKELPITTITLDLSSNRIADVADEAFQNLPKLQEINLSHNQLKTLRKEVFRGLRSLERLHLENNAFDHIAADTFSNAVNLHELHLSNNALQPNSTDQSFLSQSELKQLHCNNCSWTQLYDDIFVNLTGLEILMLDHNEFEEINTRAFAPLQRLIKLALPSAEADSLTALCQLLESIDNISFDNYTLSCFELVLGTSFNESIKLKYPQPPTQRDSRRMNATDSSTTTLAMGQTSNTTTTTTPSTPLHAATGNSTAELPLNATDVALVLKANAGADDSTYQVAVSQEVINMLLISIMIIASVGILIGIVCRKDVCGIKTKCCRTRKPKPDEPQQPAEEILLNKLA